MIHRDVAFEDGPRALSHSSSMRAKFLRELGASGLAEGPAARDCPLVTEADLAALPAPAQQFMRFSRVVGRPRDWSFRARWDGRFRLAPEDSWMPCEVWQYDTNVDVARIFHMRLRMAGVFPTYVRDLYAHGSGHMVGKLFDAIPIVDDTSEKVTMGELVTYLNDVLLFAPSMLLDPRTTFHPIDARSFEVAVTDRRTTVSGRVFVDERGALTDFWTTDRFGRDPAKPAGGWSARGGRRRCRAGWSAPTASAPSGAAPSGTFAAVTSVTSNSMLARWTSS